MQRHSPLKRSEHQHPSLSLAEQLPAQAPLRSSLREAIRASSSAVFSQRLETFRDRLDAPNQAVYDSCLSTPYDLKDWYRDLHDIIVTSALTQIVRDENARRSAAAEHMLPAWLATCAILHDRGYALLARSRTETAAGYLGGTGAYWQNTDTRRQHSRLSSQLAQQLLFDEGAPLAGSHAIPIDEQSLFLDVITFHDHPLIGEYERLPDVGRHLFDADSIHSISLPSFVKDYLSYLDDPAVLRRARETGLCETGSFSPDDFLIARISRYYSDPGALPAGWDTGSYPLRPECAVFNESGRCIEPHSDTAKGMTDRCMLLLAECCEKLEECETTEQFQEWFLEKLNQQVEWLIAS